MRQTIIDEDNNRFDPEAVYRKSITDMDGKLVSFGLEVDHAADDAGFVQGDTGVFVLTHDGETIDVSAFCEDSDGNGWSVWSTGWMSPSSDIAEFLKAIPV